MVVRELWRTRRDSKAVRESPGAIATRKITFDAVHQRLVKVITARARVHALQGKICVTKERQLASYGKGIRVGHRNIRLIHSPFQSQCNAVTVLSMTANRLSSCASDKDSAVKFVQPLVVMVMELLRPCAKHAYGTLLCLCAQGLRAKRASSQTNPSEIW